MPDQRPQCQLGTQNGGVLTFSVPAGWTSVRTSESKQPWNQGVSSDYERDGRNVHALLVNRWGRSSGGMTNARTGMAVDKMTHHANQLTLTLMFYASKDGTMAKTKLEDAKAYVNSITASKISDDEDEIIFQITTSDQAGNLSADQITTVTFTRTMDNDPLKLKNIQGDVIPGLPKSFEYFYYFQITDVNRFRQTFKDFVLPKIVNSFRLTYRPPPSAQTNPDDPFIGLNVAFSSLGTKLFGLDPGAIGDAAFERGQMADSRTLGDAGSERGGYWSPDWEAEYKANIHGLFLITAYSDANAKNFIQQLEDAFTWAPRRSSLRKVVALRGYLRPGAQAVNDPFGYRGGGISNPQVKGVTFAVDDENGEVRYTGAPVIPMGVLVMGREGDDDAANRPEWAKDGSLIATRKLNCLVPEWNAYLAREGPKLFPTIAPNDAAERLGARLMGRWKNGTPVVLSPDNDAPEIAADDKRLNNFEFDQADIAQKKCPFAAHMRKSNPRNDVPESERLKHLIRRHNMPYGPEVSDDERQNGTLEERGLHPCSYQSSIERGFRTIQVGWYNDPDFPRNKPTQPGWDPLCGQTGTEPDQNRFMSGVDPVRPQTVTTFMERFVDPRGGEYFFSPSMSTLKQYIAAQ